jgi:hypothetical protein
LQCWLVYINFYASAPFYTHKRIQFEITVRELYIIITGKIIRQVIFDNWYTKWPYSSTTKNHLQVKHQTNYQIYYFYNLCRYNSINATPPSTISLRSVLKLLSTYTLSPKRVHFEYFQFNFACLSNFLTIYYKTASYIYIYTYGLYEIALSIKC